MKISHFRQAVLDIVATIPKGSVMTYKEVAHKAGNDNAARAVGAIMRTNFNPAVPCHRVIRTDRSMAGYNRGGGEQKRLLLISEGVDPDSLR